MLYSYVNKIKKKLLAAVERRFKRTLKLLCFDKFSRTIIIQPAV